MGDVALTIPVLQSVAVQNPNVKLTILTKKPFAPIFYLIPNLEILTPDFKKSYKGIFGLFKLYKGLKEKRQFDMIIDLHNVLRSNILNFFFRFNRVPIYKIDKGRTEKTKFTAKDHPEIEQLQHVTERYEDVFRKAKLKVDLSNYKKPLFKITKNVEKFLSDKNTPFIGIAPFAAHETKQLPLEKMRKIIAQLIFNIQIVAFLYSVAAKKKDVWLMN